MPFYLEEIYNELMSKSEYKVKVYSENDFKLWNDFVVKAKNATFLFYRDFMEYHKDRFEDHSLLVFKNDKLVALLPANKKGRELYSHQGLTYGGLVSGVKVCVLEAKKIVQSILNYLKINDFETFLIKQLPQIYCSLPSYEFEYVIKKMPFQVYETNLILAVDLRNDLNIHKSKLKNYRRALSNNVQVKESNMFGDFWNRILEPKLKEKYSSKPVHTLNEITKLKEKFPTCIRQFNAYLEDEIIAGITLFEKNGVVKSQYGAANQLGEKNKALDYLFLELIYKFKNEGKTFFSMGTVSNDSEQGFNEGMLKQKQELGCAIFLQDFYKIEL